MEGDGSRTDAHQITAFDGFDDALAAVIVACDRLTTASWNHDVVRAELAARTAVASWLHACAALQRLDSGTRFRGPRWRIAAFALAANRRAVVESLDQAQRLLADASLQQVLRHLAQTLALVAAESARPVG